MQPEEKRKAKEKRFFAVTALGQNRWYWVVWPSLAQIRVGQTDHVADGYEPTKAEAVDRALNAAGLEGEWVAGVHARRYHQHLNRQKQGAAQENAGAASPVSLEFLYRDIQEPATQQWHSIAHRVVKKSRKFVYVEQRPYQPAGLSGSWLDLDAPTFRLSRAMLEQEGYALTPLADLDDPLFFTTPYAERLALFSDEAPACLNLLNLSFPCSVAQVKAAYRQRVKQVHPDYGGKHEDFLALQAAYQEALRLCRYSNKA